MPRKHTPARQRRAIAPGSSRLSRPRNGRRRRRAAGGSAFGLGTQLHTGYRLVRATPGLSIYLAGGLLVWLLGRTLAAQGFAANWWGALAADVVRLLGIALVVLLYFRRTGQLGEIRAGIARLRALHGTGGVTEHRAWWLGLGSHCRVRQTRPASGTAGTDE
jgi:hypothetical protein